MWLLPEQLAPILEGAGLQAGGTVPAGGDPHRLQVAIRPDRGTIRLALRPLAPGARGPGAAVEVDARERVGGGHVHALLASAGLERWVPIAGAPLLALAGVFAEHELLWLEADLVAGARALHATRARALCDENAAYRNERVAGLLAATRPPAATRLKAVGIDFVALDGAVALLSVGAGETMAAMDLLEAAGCRAACFLDLSGGFDEAAVTAAFREVAALPGLRAVLVNVFGGLTRVDRVAESILAALDALGGAPGPLVLRLEGTEADRGRALVEARGVRCERTLRGAIAAAVAAAGGTA